MLYLTDHYSHLVKAYCKRTGLSHTYICQLSGGNSMLLNRIEAGHTITVNTYTKAIRWLSVNWPDDLDWPEDIPRPEAQNDAA